MTTGVYGLELFVHAVTKVIPDVNARARQIDDNALNEMVNDARAKVPEDTGLLFGGITGQIEGDQHIFQAAASKDGGEDYAHFVELGRGLGATHYTASDGVFSVPAEETSAFATQRRSNASGQDREPEPFFYPAAGAALEKRAQLMQDALDGASNDWES